MKRLSSVADLVRAALAVGLLSLPATAATMDLPDGAQAPAGRGTAMQQRFLDSGASVVTTADTQLCVVSKRIDIAASDYRAVDGMPVPWAEVIRSPAASTQAVRGAEGPVRFRVQLKYSPAPQAPIVLRIGTEELQVADLLEPSTDSLWLEGAVAERLAAAFRAGDPVTLVARSRDTARTVTDTLAAPDLAALDACQAGLGAREPLPPLANQVSLDFDATPDPASLATLEEMKTCGMTPVDAPLHLGRIRSTTGFFSHTDKVFVTFDAEGRVDRVYIPGIFDAGLGGRAEGEAQVSRAADGNVPGAENDVTGCIGAAAMHICHTPEVNGPGHLLHACGDPLPGASGDQLAYLDPPGRTGPPGGRPPGNTPPRTGTPPGNPPPFVPPPLDPPDREGDPDDPDPPPPPPIPLPATAFLLLAGLGGLAALRRRRMR